MEREIAVHVFGYTAVAVPLATADWASGIGVFAMLPIVAWAGYALLKSGQSKRERLQEESERVEELEQKIEQIEASSDRLTADAGETDVRNATA